MVIKLFLSVLLLLIPNISFSAVLTDDTDWVQGSGTIPSGACTLFFLVRRDRTADTGVYAIAEVLRTGASQSSNGLEFNLGNGNGAPADDPKARINDAQSGGGTETAYVDGVQQSGINPMDDDLTNGQFYTFVLKFSNLTAGTTYEIGRFNVNGSSFHYLDGSISEYAHWSTELSDQEIAQLSNSFVKGLPLQIDASNLVTYLSFDECVEGSTCSGTDLFEDKTQNGNDGTPQGSTIGEAETYYSYP